MKYKHFKQALLFKVDLAIIFLIKRKNGLQTIQKIAYKPFKCF